MGMWRTSRSVSSSWSLGAFTLVELLVVMALMAVFSAVLLSQFSGGGSSAVLQSAQSALAGTITLARTRALASGQPCRLAFNIDPRESAQPSRYLRFIVLQINGPTGWQSIKELYLPEGAYFLPGDFAVLPLGLFAEGTADWVKADELTPLRSTVLRSGQIITETINSNVAELWVSFSISPIGATAQAGDLVLASGRQRAPGFYLAGESPVELYHRDGVHGITLSSYGLAVLIADRSGF